MKVEWSRRAERGAEDAMRFIARDRPAAARAWFEALRRRVGDLSRFPKRGRVVPELTGDEYRELIIAPYRVVYKIDSNRILVLAVRHGRQARSEARER